MTLDMGKLILFILLFQIIPEALKDYIKGNFVGLILFKSKS
jgi:hypothetical protein